MLRTFLAAACGLALLTGSAAAEEKSPIELKLILKKESIAWPYDLGPKEFETKLKESIKNKAGNLPKPPAVDLVLQFTNTGKEAVTILIEGDANLLTLTLKGPGVVNAEGQRAFTREFRGSKPLALEPGKSGEIPIKALSDGFRKVARNVYPTQPGEYTLSATYQLAADGGGKGPLLKSDEVKLKVEEPK